MSAVLRHRDRIEGDLVIEVAFTASDLDVSDHADDDVRRASLAAIAAATGGARPVTMHQVHGAEAALVDGRRPATPAVTCDALYTRDSGVALLARAADCVPVLLADPESGWIGAVHAGRAGVESVVVSAAIAALAERGARVRTAWIGPHICGRCYEVPVELRDRVAHAAPEAAAETLWRTPSLDLGAAVRAQLRTAGVSDVRAIDVCTREDRAWPSYRRDGEAATRFAGLIWSHP